MTKFALPFAALAAVLALSGCTVEETPAQVKKEASAPVQVSDAAEPTTEEPDEETAQEEGPELATLGDTVSVGDWDVKVVAVKTNADEIIKKANQFNDKPKHQYTLVTYQATYTGAERTADAWADLSWSLTTTDSKVRAPASAVTPADNQSWTTEARSGGTVKGQEVWDVPVDQVKGGILTVEGYDAEFNTVYADFQL